MSVLSAIERQMRDRPSAIAMVHGDRRVTYGELQAILHRIESGLRRQGVGRGSLVATYLRLSPERIAALLAIWRAGAAYLPLDPDHSAERTAFMLEDAAVQFLLTEESLSASVPDTRATVCLLELLTQAKPRRPFTASGGRLPEDELAYIIYTSGSTGRPKGAMIPHRALANTLDGLQRDLQLRPSDILLASNSVAFDVSGQEMYLPLMHGASIYLAERDIPADGMRLRQVLESAGITIMMGLGTSYRLLLDAGWQGDHNLQLTVGGEALSFELARAIAQRCRALWNHYGPTETSITATSERMDAAVDRITIGRPLHGVRIYVLDERGDPAPQGAVGEIYIGGGGVGLGYHNNPALTGQVFLPDPFAGRPGATMYKTGDQGALLADGRLEFFGRSDDQVKIRGFRIELQEVEGALEAVDGVKGAVVRAIEFAADDKRLIAFFVADRVIGSNSLRSALRHRLPPYMIPGEFYPLAAFPLTASGKVDRRALDTIRLQSATPDAVVSAGGEIEGTLQRIWQTLLRVRSVRGDDNFFDLGGHSLLAARMLTEVEKHLGVRVPVSHLAEYPTIHRLAEYLRRQAQERPTLLVRMQPNGSRLPLFLAHGIGGSLLTFQEMVRGLGEDQPVYGLTMPSSFAEMGGGGRGPDLVQRLAASYVQHIRSIVPHGPYQLAGHSSAALVMVEVAQQLSRGGSAVHLLALLDADIGHAPPAQTRWRRLAAMRRFVYHNFVDARQALHTGVGLFAKRRFDYYKRKFQLAVLPHVPSRNRFFSAGFMTEGHLVLALNTYRPESYPGHVVHFQGQEEPRRHQDPALGWRPHIGGLLENVLLPGDHHSIFTQPCVQELSLLLRARLYPGVELPGEVLLPQALRVQRQPLAMEVL